MATLKRKKKEKKGHSLHYCVLFKIDSLPKEICVLSSFSRDCCCIFFYPSCYIFYENRIKTTMIVVVWVLLCCFILLFNTARWIWASSDWKQAFKLFVVYHTQDYISIVQIQKVGTSHILSECHTCCQLPELSYLLWRKRSHTWNHDILILTVWLGNIYIHWVLLSHYLLWRHAHMNTHTHTEKNL